MSPTMPKLAVVDTEAFVLVPAPVLAVRLTDPGHLARWASGLRVHPYTDRGAEGLRATVSGDLVGRVEWWLEPVAHPAGTHVHFWLAATPTRDGRCRPRPAGWWQRRQQRLLLERTRRRWQHALFALADELEPPRDGGAAG